MRLSSLALAFGLAAHSAASAAGPAAPAPTPKPAPVKAITGKVTGPDGKPIAAATVRAIPAPVRTESAGPSRQRADVPRPILSKTDAAGSFRLEGLALGLFVVRVEAPGLAPAQAGDVPLGAALNLKLRPGTTVVGRVLDLTTQKPIAGANVTALEHDAARFGRDAAHAAKTGDDGTFQVAGCAAGVVTVEAIAPGKARARLDRVVAKPLPAGDEPKFDTNTLYLQPGGRIGGRVVGPDDKPLADALVTASGSEGNLLTVLRDGRMTLRTDADGRFEFDGVLAGNKYSLRAVKEGLSSRDEGPIAIEAGTDRGDLELKLESGANLSFRLVTAQDVPVKDVEARLQPQGGGRRRGFGQPPSDVDRDKIVSQGDGKFLLKSLDAGTFDVTLQPPDFADVVREGVKLKSGETVDLGTLRVKESKSIGGKITDATGQPVPGASISGLWIDGEARLSREAHSGTDGRYRLSGLGDQAIRNLSVRATGFAAASREGAMPGDTAVDFTLEKTGSIVGRVQLRGGAAPAAFRVQASAEAKEKQERPGFRMVIGGRSEDEPIFTDPSGNFRLDNVEPGTVTVTVKADGKAPTRKSGLKVVSDQISDAGTIILDDGRALRGRVVAAKDDAPVPGATVSVSQPQGFMMGGGRDSAAGIAISGLDGRFEIAGLESKTYSVDASQPDYSPNNGRVEISADADTDDFVIKLSRGGAITGVVRDAQRVPVVNASILLTKIPMSGGPQTVSTGTDGHYAFEKIAPGEYMVIRAPSGGGPLMLMSGMKQVVVREGETTVHDIDESAKINLTGRVLKGGQPVANAMLIFSAGAAGEAPTDMKQSRSDAEGRYQVGLDAAGTYGVAVVSGGAMFGGGRSAVSIQVPDQPNPVVDVTVKAAGITGRVVNQEGKPVSGAVVTATGGTAPAGGHGGGRGTQDQSEPDGTFSIDGLDPGTYTIAVAAAGYRNADVPPVTIANDNDVPSIEVRLTPGRTVRGRVIDANGNGIGNAMVMVASAGSAASGRDAMPATSDVNGAFVVTAPADGAIDLTAVASGFPAARASSVEPQEGVEVVLRAPRAGRIRVTVVDRSGTAVSNAKVSYRAVPDFLGAGYLAMFDKTSLTDGSGATTILSLGPGGYELTVSSGNRKATRALSLAEGAESVETVTLP